MPKYGGVQNRCTTAAISLRSRCIFAAIEKYFIGYQDNLLLSSEKFRSKSDLFIKIKRITLLLNNKYRDGSKVTPELGFDRARYAIVLLAAISSPSFTYHTKKIQNSNFASYYNLYKVAKALGLEYERNRAAPNTYAELTQRGHVKTVVEDNRTFITFTENGKKNCEEILEDMQDLNEHINSREDRRSGLGTAKGGYAGSPYRPETEREIDRLIGKISQW